MWARIYLIPALQAEEDRDQVRRYLADQAREKELLGSNTKVYNSDRQATPFEHEGLNLTVALQVRPTNVRCHTGEGAEVDTEGWRRKNAGQSVHRRAPWRGGMRSTTTTMYTLLFGHVCVFSTNETDVLLSGLGFCLSPTPVDSPGSD